MINTFLLIKVQNSITLLCISIKLLYDTFIFRNIFKYFLLFSAYCSCCSLKLELNKISNKKKIKKLPGIKVEKDYLSQIYLSAELNEMQFQRE